MSAPFCYKIFFYRLPPPNPPPKETSVLMTAVCSLPPVRMV